MILLTILSIIALLLTAIAVISIAVGGTAFVLVFGDVIVCVVFIVLLIKYFHKKRKR